MKKIFINILFLCIILIIFMCINNYNKIENKREKKTYEFLSIEEEVPKINEDIQTNSKEKILDIYNGYKVCAKLDIPEISLETYVLGSYSQEALNVSVVKFWGVNPNEVGNFCIAGHNFKNKNMFSNLKRLNLGNKLYITDNKNGKVEYEIFKIYTVFPEDINCLYAVTKNEKEVTLITCTIDSQKRIIVKAKEI